MNVVRKLFFVLYRYGAIATLGWAACKANADRFAPPQGITLATAKGEKPRASSQATLSVRGLELKGAPPVDVAQLRDSQHDRALRDRLARTLGASDDLLLYVDAATPFELLEAAIGVFGYGGVREDHIALAVKQENGATGSIPLEKPVASSCMPMLQSSSRPRGELTAHNSNDVPCSATAPPQPTLQITSRSFGVAVSGVNFDDGCIRPGPGPAVPDQDVSRLRICLAHLMASHPALKEPSVLAIRAYGALRFDALARILETVRTDENGRPLFQVTFDLPKEE